MPHAPIENLLGFGYDTLLVNDLGGVPMFVPLIQSRYAISVTGDLSLLEEQPPPNLAGAWYGDPAATSIKYEPQIAYLKRATDVVLHGHAYPAKPGDVEGQVGIRVGPVQKLARVIGDRRLVKTFGIAGMTAPEPFERIPMTYERCFGGWDRRHPNPEQHRYEPRNPVGAGFYDSSLPIQSELLAPNFEDPSRLYEGYGDNPPPCGFGFIGAGWQPRVAYAGTYDDSWDKQRKPLLPLNFDETFYNAAAPKLIAPGHLQGNEPVIVLGATPAGRIAFNLPGASSPVCVVELRTGHRVSLLAALDTVIVDCDTMTLTLLWRAHLQLRGGIHDVRSVELRADIPAENSRAP